MINNVSKKSGLKIEHSDIIKRNKLENTYKKKMSECASCFFSDSAHNNLCKLDSQILGILLVNVIYALRRFNFGKIKSVNS